MPAWPDPAWFDEVCAAPGAPVPGLEPFDALVAVEVAVEVGGGPSGTVVEHWAVAGGRLVAGGRGAPDGADLACTVTATDLTAMHEGVLDPAVAFMQGRLKVAGDPGQVVALVSLAHGLAASGRP
jgi:hypothetical protein